MKNLLFMLILLYLTGVAHAQEDVLAEYLHQDKESYLIVIYEAKPAKDTFKNNTQFNATIVQVLNGKKKVGDKIIFNRVFEEKPEDFSRFIGGMFYVRYDKATMNGSPIEGQFYVDSQDPTTLAPYSKKRAEFIFELLKKQKVK